MMMMMMMMSFSCCWWWTHSFTFILFVWNLHYVFDNNHENHSEEPQSTTLPKTNRAPQKETIVFQPSIIRHKLLVEGRVKPSLHFMKSWLII